MKPRGQEIVQWGEAALEQLCGPVFEQVRNKFAQWRDPRARLLRQRRRAKRATTAGTVSTGVLGAGAVTSAAADSFWAFLPAAQDITTFGLGGLAVATGIGAVGAGARYFRLKRTPLPPPGPPPAALPPQGSQAREPVQRLRDAERALHSASTAVADWTQVRAVRFNLTYEGPDAGVSTAGTGQRLVRNVAFTVNFRNLQS